jgi:uncharacterized protein (DUF4213/DUF364 family)
VDNTTPLGYRDRVSIVEAVRACAAGHDRGSRVAHAAAGAIYAAVELEGGFVGVAYRFPEAGECPRATGRSSGKSDPRAAGRWEGRPAAELLRLLGSPDLLDSALALATANAVAALDPPGGSAAGGGVAGGVAGGDVLEHLDLRDGDRVCMVGCFPPVLERLGGRGIEVVAVDESPRPGALPAEQVDVLLPGSQVAIITATALVNRTLDRLLDLASSCRTVALLGPSTPLLPRAFAGTPVRLLSGIRVTEPLSLLKSVAAGGGFRDFRPYVRKVNVAV